ncbi:MAG: 7-cyano-7-deazaguanine synthase, partial [Planctomycetota bacterium]|nr:7-cyano-7-deazaguanine synthase [Planctomycetota bacterium]
MSKGRQEPRAKSHKPSAIVLLSGGLDSATTLAVARAEGFTCCALSFDYGQRHKVELKAARRVAAARGVAEHVIS